MATINIPALFKDIVEKVSAEMQAREVKPFPVYFDYGHYIEVTRNLTTKDGGTTFKNKKYPLIWLVMDFVERYGTIGNGYAELPDLQILIATGTRIESSTPKRMEESFLPVLYPVYEELKNQIAASGYFAEVDPSFLPHEKIDRPYWGGQDSQGNGKGNLFNDFIDAIQLRRLKLTVNAQVCDQFNILSS